MPHLLPAVIVALSLAGMARTDTMKGCSPVSSMVSYEYTTGEYAGCSGQIETASCSGDCYSEMEPRVYQRKYDMLL